jgi:hypothetical protein
MGQKVPLERLSLKEKQFGFGLRLAALPLEFAGVKQMRSQFAMSSPFYF